MQQTLGIITESLMGGGIIGIIDLNDIWQHRADCETY